MLLPKEKRSPHSSLGNYTILLYGQPKIGKSTFASEFDEPLFLATEPGLKSLSVYEVPITDWETFLKACGEISKGNHQFKTIVIDTVDNLYKACVEHMNTKLGIQHEGDLPYGKGYAMIKGEFFRALKKLAMLDYGLVLTSHVSLEKKETRTESFVQSVPTLPDSIRKIVIGWVDIILFADIKVDGERILRTCPDEKWIAGDRTEKAFGRKLPEEIPLNFKEFEKYFYGGEVDER